MYDHAKAIRHALLVAKSAASQVGLPPIYRETGGEVPSIKNPMSVFPKPQRMWDTDMPGGAYLSMPSQKDVTGHKAAEASISIAPGGKPSFTVSQDAVDQTGTSGKGNASIKTNLFKKKAGWKWLNAPEGHEDTNTLVSVYHRKQHHYALATHFPNGVDLARYPDQSSEPRLRPSTVGNLEFGPQVGSISVRGGKEHPVYKHIIAKDTGGEVDDFKPVAVNPESDQNRDKFMEGAHPDMFDEHGAPKRWYHGTPRSFKKFNRYESDTNPGMHFVTSDPVFASRHTFGEPGSNVMPLHVNVKNPFDYENPEHLKRLIDHVPERWMHQYSPDELKSGNWGIYEEPEVKRAIRDLGHDSMYVSERNIPSRPATKNLAIFNDPRTTGNHIKSAIGNNGNWDPEKPEITESNGGFIDRIGKAGGGGFNDGGGFDPDAGAFGRIGTDPQQQLQSSLEGPQIIKQPGGQWFSGSVEDALEPLKKGVWLSSASVNNVDPEYILKQASMVDKGHELIKPTQEEINKSHKTKAVNDFVGKQLTRYVKNDMGTEGDPVRALAERGILHVPDHHGYILDSHFLDFNPSTKKAKSDLANAWEKASDLQIKKDLASSWKKSKDPIRQHALKYNPWIEKIDPNTEVHLVHSEMHAAKALGFDHLVDELHNSVNPESGLPNHLQLNPESLSRMSVPQAVQHVHNINKWREDNRAEANKKLAFNPATFLHKDYPNSDYAWYQIRHPDMTDEEKSFLENNHIDENDYPQSLKDKGRALDEALKYEGDTMGHCVGGYSDEVANGESNIYSLRNKKTGEPHVTVETKHSPIQTWGDITHVYGAEKAKKLYEGMHLDAPVKQHNEDFQNLVNQLPIKEISSIEQIKGKGNKKPVDRYLPYVQDFVKSGNWGKVGDLHNTGLRNMDIQNTPYSNLVYQMTKAGEDVPKYMTEEEYKAAEKRHFPQAATGGAIIAKAVGGSIDPQKAIRRAMMVARQTRDVGGRTMNPLEGPPTSYFEVAPGKTWDAPQQESWEQLHPQAKAAISHRMIEEFVPKWKKQTGIKGELSHGLGGFGGYTNPNFTFRPNNPADINPSMNGLGELFRQDSMMGAHHEPFEGSFPSGLVRIRLPKNATDDHVHNIYTSLNKAGLAEGHSTDLENRTMDILAGSNHDEALEAAHKMDKVLGGKYNLHAYPIDISFPSHGENYGRIQPPKSERPDASVPNTDNPLQAEAAERLKSLLAEAHLQGGGHEKPVDFSSLDSISRIYGGKIKVPSQSLIIPGSPEGTLGVSGAPGVTFMGKQPHEFTPAEWGHFGEEHGVPSLGPKDTAKWQSGLQKIKTLSGREMTVPGGIDNPEPFSYYDLLHLKSQGIDPNDLPSEVHQKIHDRMISAMQPEGKPSPTQVANQMMFGMISPNQPLTPNELALQRIMAKGPRDIETLASMVPHHYADEIPSRDQLNHFSRAITNQLGLHAASRGGIGASGSANYADIAEFAQKMRDRPDFFTFDPTNTPGNSPSEKWSNHVAKVINEVRGLSAKTGSLASVWQSPKDAAISAIDRHMATKFQNNVFENPKEQQAWQQATLKAFNADRKKVDRVGSFQQMLETSGGRGHFVDAILAHVNNIPSAKTRIKRTGEYNPSIPEGLRNVNWVSREPEQMSMIAGPYVRALEQNQREAEKAGQGLFSNQWMLWDRIRNRLEPHEILYPGLEKLPRMSLEQMRKVRDDLSKSGYMAESGTVKPLPTASHAGYFSSGGLVDRAMQLVAHLGRN